MTEEITHNSFERNFTILFIGVKIDTFSGESGHFNIPHLPAEDGP